MDQLKGRLEKLFSGIRRDETLIPISQVEHLATDRSPGGRGVLDHALTAVFMTLRTIIELGSMRKVAITAGHVAPMAIVGIAVKIVRGINEVIVTNVAFHAHRIIILALEQLTG
jgi:hypothetical protein